MPGEGVGRRLFKRAAATRSAPADATPPARAAAEARASLPSARFPPPSASPPTRPTSSAPWSLSSVDTRFSIRGTQEPPADLVLVQIDDVTFGQLQRQWPFPRSLHARLIDRLREAGAKAIAYDVQFTEPTEPARGQRADPTPSQRAGGVVLSTTEVDAARRTQRVRRRGRRCRQIGARAGNTVDPARPRRGAPAASPTRSTGPGELRRSPPPKRRPGSRSTATTLGGDGDAWIDYRGPPGTIRDRTPSRASCAGRCPTRRLPRQDRRRRRLGALAAGRPRDLDDRRAS